ncbi:MAG: factor-independent urate hydroxylase [Candidatus Limnocylindrales bacterium]
MTTRDEGRSIRLATDRYGKARIRLVKVLRDAEGDRLKDLTIQVALEGDFEAAHTRGDNSLVVATDTMKNTAYALALGHLSDSIEAYGLVLASHFLAFPQVERATVEIAEARWSPLSIAGKESDHAFVRSGELTRSAHVSATAAGATIEAGLEGLTLMKTRRSAFSGFDRDRYTTLAETDDRLMATKVTSEWRYGSADVDFEAAFAGVLATLLRVFSEHDSASVQASIWIIGKAILEEHAELEQIRFELPNLHHWPADLSPFGLRNDAQVYVASAEPHGLIEATIVRD